MSITVYTTKILIVEDEAIQRRLLSAQLEREGYDVVLATNGREGLQAIGDDPDIRLVITDLSMPEMDGFELIKQIRRTESHYTYIIVLTAHDQKDSLIRALGLGADDYLAKPVVHCGNDKAPYCM